MVENRLNIKTTKPPTYKLGGVILTNPFTWKMRPGAKGFLQQYKCIKEEALAIQKAATVQQMVYTKSDGVGRRQVFSGGYPSVTLELECEINFTKYTKKIENILLLRLTKNDVINYTLDLADIRFFFNYEVFRGYYNMKRRINDFTLAKAINETQDRSEIEKLNVFKVFEDRYLLEKNAYQKYSVKRDGEPWKALEILERIMLNTLGKWWGGFVQFDQKLNWQASQPTWSDVVPEDFGKRGVPLIQVVEELMYLSRSNGACFSDGKFYVYPMVDDDIKSRLPPNYEDLLTSDSKISKLNNIHLRPSSYEILFEREHEVPFDFHFEGVRELVQRNQPVKPEEDKQKQFWKMYNETLFKAGLDTVPFGAGSELSEELQKSIDKAKRAVITPTDEYTITQVFLHGNLKNVLKLPFELKIGGEYYEAGTWLPIVDVILEFGFDYQSLLKFWHEGAWQVLFADKYIKTMRAQGDGDYVNKNVNILFAINYDSRLQMLVNAIQQHFWRTFMIDETLRDLMIKWSDKRTAVAQRRTGKRIQSSVWCEYINFLAVRVLADYKANSKDRQIERLVQNIGSELEGLALNEILQEKPSPFIPNVVDIDAGVIGVDYSKDQRGYHFDFEPGQFFEEKMPVGSPKQNMSAISQQEKKPKFDLATLLNVTWGEPNGLEGCFILAQKTVIPGLGPLKRIFCEKETARFAWRTTYKELADIVSNPPINLDVMKIFAASMVNVEEFKMKDWYTGDMTLAGLFNIEPFGNATITINASDTCTTSISMGIPDAPSIYQDMTYDNRRFAFGEGIS